MLVTDLVVQKLTPSIIIKGHCGSAVKHLQIQNYGQKNTTFEKVQNKGVVIARARAEKRWHLRAVDNFPILITLLSTKMSFDSGLSKSWPPDKKRNIFFKIEYDHCSFFYSRIKYIFVNSFFKIVIIFVLYRINKIWLSKF